MAMPGVVSHAFTSSPRPSLRCGYNLRRERWRRETWRAVALGCLMACLAEHLSVPRITTRVSDHVVAFQFASVGATRGPPAKQVA